ncbi:MAG: hypothetical protein NTZ67_08505 [Gammaproteobacteria bacterium]|nr:hypothetical protein [Gammaproteobacteria bacterium]
MAVQSCGLLFVASVTVFFISHVNVEKLSQWADILFALSLIEVIVFYTCYNSIFPDARSS